MIGKLIKIFFSILIVSFTFVINANHANACNNLRVTIQNATYSLNSNNNPALTARVQRSGTAQGCSFFLVFDYGTASSFSTRRLQNGIYEYPVNIYKDAAGTQILKSITDAATTNDILSGIFPAGSGSTTSNQTYRPKIVPENYRRFGTFTQTFNVGLYSGTLASNTFVQSRTATLTYTQAKQIDLSLVNTGAAFNTADTSQTVNFGNLSQGQTSTFDLIVSYNAGYSLVITSTNNGRLKLSTSAVYIPYTFKLNGSTIDLSTGSVDLTDVTGISPTGGQRLPIELTVGSLGSTIPGSYSDNVTLSVTSVE